MTCVGIKPFDNFHLGLPFFLFYFFSKRYTRNICSKQCQNMTYEHVYFRRMESGGNGIRKERGLFCTTMYFLFSWELSAKKSIIAWMNEIWINLHNITTTPTLALKCQFTHNLKKPFYGDNFPTMSSLSFTIKKTAWNRHSNGYLCTTYVRFSSLSDLRDVVRRRIKSENVMSFVRR